MRAGHTYHCPKCGEEFDYGVTCFRCDILPVDENGNRPPPTFAREAMALSGSETGTTADMGFFVMALGDASLRALAREVRELNHRRKARRALREPLQRIADASAEPFHVRGIVEVLESVKHPDGEEVAMYLCRRLDVARHTVEAIETRLACGKLLVRDETGVALLDDDFFFLLPTKGHHPMARYKLDIIVRAGDTIEIAGHAERRAMPQLSQADAGGYRTTPTVLAFDGSTDHLLSILPVQVEPTA